MRVQRIVEPRIVLFEEEDYFFWVGLALVVGRLDWVLYLLGTVRFFAMLGTVVVRGMEMRRLDSAIGNLRS